MTPRKTIRNGKECWTVDLRSEGKGRIFAPTKGEVLERLRKVLAGWSEDEIVFDASDRLAKHELGDSGTLLEAVRYFKAHRVGGVKKPFADAVTECVAEKKMMGLRKAYTSHLEHILKTFSTYVGNVDCSAVGSQHVKNFLFRNDWTHGTRAGVRNRLSALFAWCVANNYLKDNPAKGAPLGRAEKVVPQILTVEQVHRLLDTALVLDPVMVPYFTLGIFCGIRPEELARIRNSNCVRMERGIVDIPAEVSKTRDRRIVDLPDNAKSWLLVSRSSVRFARRRFRDVVKASQVEWSHDVMRHTFASYHLEFHGSADKTAMQMGHQGSTRMLFRHYKATVEKADAIAFWKIEPAISLNFMPELTASELRID